MVYLDTSTDVEASKREEILRTHIELSQFAELNQYTKRVMSLSLNKIKLTQAENKDNLF